MTGSRNGAALLIVDMINTFQFEGVEALLPKLEALTEVILDLRGQAERLGVPTIYINDNYGQWHSDQARVVQSCLTPDNPAADCVRRLAPREQDDFIFKPQMSGFYSTNLQVMLPRLGISRLVVTGIQADICILFTAADAHMRDYDLWVPADAVASEQDERRDWALRTIGQAMQASVEPTRNQSFSDWVEATKG